MIDLRLGDCLEILKTIPDKSIDLIVTDPPYQISITGGAMIEEKQIRYVQEKQLSGIDNGYNPQILDECLRVLKAINIYIFCSHYQIVPLLEKFVNERKCHFNILTWHKENPLPYCGNTYLKDTEWILFFREQGVPLYGNWKTKKTWYTSTINVKDKARYQHPTIKPLNIIRNFITNSSKAGDVILDPFSGSGTTGVACVQTGRNFIGCEINESYYTIAERRIGEAIQLESETLPFEIEEQELLNYGS